ncbi:NADP dehydrogenase [ubiquinone] iron-sulfur protein 7, mitochondrial [Plakobranchus ocellatus]|uniref:NADP dehydrogenase [ubiquinone] iron-sulfur protein 7, mitochondrial n=1 Tax=Plakobranchus ocellatus TaxID=259542 RepID=A0AAV3YHZ2_9GAST|nr:NADP dehydrogenase [ubiquinone] iron-sulfur protein 7, mitochondrial [Plakobranchus ocellatus]
MANYLMTPYAKNNQDPTPGSPMLGLSLYPKGQKARALRREPEKEEPYTGHRFYDSVEGCPRNHKEFVVYESRRALVEGIITFSVEKKKKEKVETDAFFTDDLDDVNDLNANDTDSDNQSEPGGDVEGALSNLSSSDDDEGGDDKYKGYDSSDSSETTDSSDSEAGRLRFFTSDEIDQILIQKNRQFGDATGVTDQLEIERYLLRGNMNVDEAVKIYEEKKAQGFPESESEEEWEDPFAHNHPLPGSEGWDQLSEEDQKAFIEGQIDDFILITGIDVDEREVARQCLTAVNMNLDNAVLAYYDAL